MNKKYTSYNLNKRVTEIIAAIDLNYILAEARKENYTVTLVHGIMDDHIKWSDKTRTLSYNFETASLIIQRFLNTHKNKIIKVNVSSDDDIYPLDRNMIIYVPYEIEIEQVRKEYSSIIY